MPRHSTSSWFFASRSCAMPALPGALQSFETCGDWASFHTSACSRPPEPTTRSFIGAIESGTEAGENDFAAHFWRWTFDRVRVNGQVLRKPQDSEKYEESFVENFGCRVRPGDATSRGQRRGQARVERPE